MQPNVLSALMFSFLVPPPGLSRQQGGSDEECNFFVSHISLKNTDEWLSTFYHKAKHWKICENLTSLQSDKQASRQKWCAGHQSRHAKLTFMMGSTSRLCNGSWIRKDLAAVLFLCFLFQSAWVKWVTGPSWWNAFNFSLNQFYFALINAKIQT